MMRPHRHASCHTNNRPTTTVITGGDRRECLGGERAVATTADSNLAGHILNDDGDDDDDDDDDVDDDYDDCGDMMMTRMIIIK